MKAIIPKQKKNVTKNPRIHLKLMRFLSNALHYSAIITV
jgi:hypothetical protein